MTVTAQRDRYALMTQQARATWALGDLTRDAAEHVLVAELLYRTVDIHPGEPALDVAAGSVTAARRGAAVIATGFVPQLLQAMDRRAQAEGLPLETEEADAQRLPFADGAFDIVLSTSASCSRRPVARRGRTAVGYAAPGGRIGLTAWTPRRVMAAMQAAAAPFAPSPAAARRQRNSIPPAAHHVHLPGGPIA